MFRQNLLVMAPRIIPPLSTMLDDLGHPSPAQVGRLLQVHPRTVQRWIASDAAPRPVLLALFWLTRWGRSSVESAAVREAQLSAAVAQAAQRVAEQHAAEIAHLQAVGDFGAANAPLLRPGRPGKP